MLLAPWRHHGDHAQAHREATGGKEEECEGGEEGREEGFDTKGFDREKELRVEEDFDAQILDRQEGFLNQINGEEGSCP
jgi:hypothetical protein